GFDVVTSASVDAFLAGGDFTSADRVAAEGPDAGVLTTLACVRLSLHTSDWRRAVLGLRTLTADPTLGPAQRVEATILAAWLEVAQTGELARGTAARLLHVVRHP